MSITFPSLFESLSGCRKESRIVLDIDSESYPIHVEESLLFGGRSMRYFSPQHISEDVLFPQNAKSNHIFIECIKNFCGEKAQSEEVVSLINHFEQNETSPLTARKIRKSYKVCVGSLLHGYRKIAVRAKTKDRLIFKEGQFAIQNESPNAEENKKAMRAFKASLIDEWGKRRVKRTEKRYEIKLKEMIEKGEHLTAELINRLIPGLSDYYVHDLIDCWETLKKIILGEKTLSTLSQRTIRKLAETFNVDISDEKGIVSKLLHSYQKDIVIPSFLKLNARALSLIQKITLLDENELELAFQGTRLEGVIDGLQTPLESFFTTTSEKEDLMRLHMYHIILTAKNSIEKAQFEPFFDEILTKGIVKKEKIVADMLVPSPWQENNIPWFYRVQERIRTGGAKFGYYLIPVGKVLKKRIIMFRSTSSTPAATDSLKSVLTGLFPCDPLGYYGRFVGEETEKKVLKDSKKILRIIGQSLGGVYAQLFLVNRIEKNDKIPVRKYEIVTFDSPKLKMETVKNFAKWIQSDSSKKLHGRISILHYTSHNDPVPHLGEALLGTGVDVSKLKSLKVIKLTPKTEKPVLVTHPHARHFFRTEKDKDFKAEEIPIEDTISRKWHFVEVIRRVIGIILFPILWLYDAIKSLFFRIPRNPEEEVSHVFQKYSSHRLKPATI